MVLVDINTIRPPEKEPLTKAINSLITSNEFSRSNFGSNALAISYLDKEMKEILDGDEQDITKKLQRYNQNLQKYLFLLRENEKPNSSVTPVPVVIQDPLAEVEAIESEPASVNTAPRASTSSLFMSTPTTSKSRYYTTARKHTSNLPRVTPKLKRLRTEAERQKNSRYKDFLHNWDAHIDQ